MERFSIEDAVIRLKSLATLRAASAPPLALIAGSMHAWTIASPVGGQPVWWLQLMALTLLVILLDRCRPFFGTACRRVRTSTPSSRCWAIAGGLRSHPHPRCPRALACSARPRAGPGSYCDVVAGKHRAGAEVRVCNGRARCTRVVRHTTDVSQHRVGSSSRNCDSAIARPTAGGYMEKLRSHFVAGIRRRSSACPWVAEKKATRIQSLD